jgi:WD40 repeat protein
LKTPGCIGHGLCLKCEKQMSPGGDASIASALIVAIENYDHYPKLESLSASASELSESLVAGGFVNALPAGLFGGRSLELADGIRSWFNEARNDNHLFLYWSGHGIRESDGLYLVTQESPSYNLDQTNALEPRFLAKSAANSKARKILIVLDACFSGEALGQVIETVSRVIGDQPPDLLRRRGIAVLASAHALQKSQEGVLSGLLTEALVGSRIMRRWSDEDQFIDADRLFALIDDEIERRALDQRIVPAAFGSTIELLPNPRYRPGLVAEIVEERAWRLARSGAAEHFDLASRGIEVGESGWYFAGRTRILRALVDWLNRAENGVRIVTGPPGAGKSAVMGRLATLSDPEYRKALIEAGLKPPGSTIPPEQIIDVAIHAKGKTLDDCARALVQALRISAYKGVALDVTGLVAAISRIDHRTTIMVDALDEAASGQGGLIAATLLVPLGRLPRVRVLVGCRRSLDGAIIPRGEERHAQLQALFGVDAIIDDLEDEAETGEDIAEYVRLRLTTSPKHSTKAGEIAAASARVAARAEGVFLYARIVSRTLQDRDRLDGELPATALEGFADDLRARFGVEQQLVDDLLAGLAWGEGKGLTRRVWPLIATAVASLDRSYDDDDVDWVLRHAGWHIIEAGEAGQAVYRLGHQALTDYYRRHRYVGETQSRIVAALTGETAGVAWFDRDRYLWRHLADHAAQAGQLGSLVRDRGYLAVAEPARLVTLLPSIGDEGTRQLADIYNRAADRLVDQQPLERLSLIHMTALMEAPDLAPLLEPPDSTRWRCRWARVRRSAPHRIIGRHNGEVSSIALAAIAGREVVASGSHDRTIRLWDAHTGERIGAPLEGHAGGITAVALGAIGDRAVVVSGSEDRTIRLWDAHSGEPIGGPLEGHTRGISAVTIGSIGNLAVVVSGSWDRTVRLWDVSKCRAASMTLIAPSLVMAVALGLVHDRAVVVSGSDDRTIRLWDAHSGEPIGNPLEGHKGAVSAVALGSVDERAVVVSGSWDRTVRLWDALKGVAISSPIEGHTEIISAVAIRKIENRTILASASDDRTIGLWDAHTGWTIREPLRGHTGPVNSVALGTIGRHAIVISASDDQTIRLWDARRDEAIGNPFEGHTGPVSAVNIGDIDGRTIVVSGSDDQTIRLWDAYTGKPIGTPLEGYAGGITAVALGVIGDRAVVVSGSEDRAIRVSDAYTGRPIGSTLTGDAEAVSTVAIGTIDGRAIVISGSDDRTIRLWHARTGRISHFWHRFKLKQVGKTLEGHKEKISAVALGVIDGRPVVISGSHDRTVRRWDARTGDPIGRALTGHTEVVNAVAFDTIEGRALVVSGSDDRTIRLWDACTGEAIGAPLESHTGGVRAVAIGNVEGRAVVVSGSEDGTVCFWNASARIPWFEVKVGMPVNYINLRSKVGLVVGSNTGILALNVGLVT